MHVLGRAETPKVGQANKKYTTDTNKVFKPKQMAKVK
jgi:hypothetical protein